MKTSGANNEAHQNSRGSENTSQPYNVADGWGTHVRLHNDRVIVNDDPSSAVRGIARRLNEVRGIDHDSLHDHIDDTIYELIPKQPELPQSPPPKGERLNALFVANWGGLADAGGSTNPEKDISASWVRKGAHDWPARYGINPIYKFYTGDSPLFYIYNPVSYMDPETETVKLPDSITWKINGQEVHKGKYLQLHNVTPTDARKVLTVDIANEAGVTSYTIMYVIENSDDDASVENFSSEYQGNFIYDPTADDGKGKAVFHDDPRYQPRRVKFKVHWSDYGNGKNTRRNFNERKPYIKIDGINYIDMLEYGFDGNVHSIRNGNDLEIDKTPTLAQIASGSQPHTFYFEKPPGPLSLEIGTQFNYSKGFKRKKRVFYKKYEYHIDLNASLTDIIDFGQINVGKTDSKR